MFIDLTYKGLKRCFRVSEIACVVEGAADGYPDTTVCLKSGEWVPVGEAYDQVLSAMEAVKEVL